mgnify:FL=1
MKKEELDQVQEKSNSLEEQINQISKKGEEEHTLAEERIHKLMSIADKSLLQTRNEKEERLKYQRSVSTLFNLESNYENMKKLTEKQERKLEVLMDLLVSSRDYLSSSITEKSQLLQKTKEAAHQISEICQQTLKEEEEFYRSADSDTMHTPPYIQVNRRKRK